eukprot:364657-Chlamydomonas_euryale.AAC.1
MPRHDTSAIMPRDCVLGHRMCRALRWLHFRLPDCQHNHPSLVMRPGPVETRGSCCKVWGWDMHGPRVCWGPGMEGVEREGLAASAAAAAAAAAVSDIAAVASLQHLLWQASALSHGAAAAAVDAHAGRCLRPDCDATPDRRRSGGQRAARYGALRLRAAAQRRRNSPQAARGPASFAAASPP